MRQDKCQVLLRTLPMEAYRSSLQQIYPSYSGWYRSAPEESSKTVSKPQAGQVSFRRGHDMPAAGRFNLARNPRRSSSNRDLGHYQCRHCSTLHHFFFLLAFHRHGRELLPLFSLSLSPSSFGSADTVQRPCRSEYPPIDAACACSRDSECFSSPLL